MNCPCCGQAGYIEGTLCRNCNHPQCGNHGTSIKGETRQYADEPLVSVLSKSLYDSATQSQRDYMCGTFLGSPQDNFDKLNKLQREHVALIIRMVLYAIENTGMEVQMRR